MELFQQSISQVDQLLKRNNLEETDIEQVLLVGGSTRIPKIRSMLAAKFGLDKVNTGLEVDEIVAQGASLYGNSPIPVQTLTVHSLGTDYVLTSTNIHTYIIIDISYSMSGNAATPKSKWTRQKNILGAVVENCLSFIKKRASQSPNDKVSIITFNHNAFVEVNGASVSDLCLVQGKLNSLTPERHSKTHYLIALQAAFKLADSHSSESLSSLFVMLSDGCDGTDSTEVESLVADYFTDHSRAVLYTIGFGRSAYFDRLRTLSRIARGDHLDSFDDISLKNAFETIAKSSGAAGKESELFYPIIERRSKIPCQRTQKFVNQENDQEEISVKVLEGENPLAADNHLLGQFSVPIVPKLAGQNVVLVTFDIDHNGLLHVTATADNETVSVTINEKPGVLTSEQMREAERQCHMLKEEEVRIFARETL
ncbi:hypothetical protein GEMRC1_013158 [Eukaryota sp. GEM-RC1]